VIRFGLTFNQMMINMLIHKLIRQLEGKLLFKKGGMLGSMS
jgi:hypothetical protein